MKKVVLFTVMVFGALSVFCQNEYIVKTSTKSEVIKSMPLTEEEKWEQDNFPYIAIPDLPIGTEFLAIKKGKEKEYVLLQRDNIISRNYWKTYSNCR
jgi:hypothetical protein